MQYQGSVKTKDRKGNEEIRLLVVKGQYVRYQYLDSNINKIVQKGKTSIILKSEDKQEHLCIIPLKDNKYLLVKPKEDEKQRKVWNPKAKKEEEMF